ncbi:MAG: YihY/virulence factor BrkB family protein [Nitrospira sp.]|nr:YihY/virulence factor BrkB family protein [Nitrospira sp.]
MAHHWKTLLQPRAFWKLFQEAFNAWSHDKIPRHGAALAYYTVLSLVPLLIVMITLIGLIFGREAAQKHILDQTTSLMGPQSGDAIKQMIEHATQPTTGTIAMLAGVATLLLGASGVFAQLQDSLNTIWRVEPKEGRGLWGLIRDRFISISAVLGTGFLLLVSLILSAALAAFGKWYGGWLPAPEIVLQLLELVISLLVIAGLFALMFKVLPDARIAWNDVWVGALLTALLFTIGKFAIGLYLGKTDVGSAYGSAGSLVIMLVWIYYSAQIVLFGAEFTQVYANEMGSRIVPTANAVPADQARAGSKQSASTQPRRQPTTGHSGLAAASQHQQAERLPWWGTVLLLWVAVTRFPRRSE